jgi:hypothetical protein
MLAFMHFLQVPTISPHSVHVGAASDLALSQITDCLGDKLFEERA